MMHIEQRRKVDQQINPGWRHEFVKEIVHFGAADGAPLIMVRKRRRAAETCRASVLLLHGFGQNRYSFHSSVRSLSCYLAYYGYDVYTLEFRGHGRSALDRSPRAKNFDDYTHLDAPAAIETIREVSGRPEVFLVGHSLGAAVAFAVAPEIDPPPAGVISLAGAYRFGRKMPHIKALAHGVELLRKGSEKHPNPPLPIRWLGWAATRTPKITNRPHFKSPIWPWLPGSFEDELVRERMTDGFDFVSWEIAAALLHSAARDGLYSADDSVDYSSRFAKLDVPLLVMAADKDGLISLDSVKSAYDESVARDKTFKLYGGREMGLSFGHIDLVMGRHAPLYVWPDLLQWLDARTAENNA